MATPTVDTSLETILDPSWVGRDVVSVHDFDRSDFEYLFALADEIDAHLQGDRPIDLMRGRVLGYCFFQPSTRTRLSFEAAMVRLGGSTVGFADAKVTRAGDFYQESLEDVVHVVSEYADAIALRHFENGAARRAAAAARVPVLNAGDGYNEHPTQALGDLYTMARLKGGLDGLRIGLVGDLHVRSLRAICYSLAKFDVARVLILPPEGGVADDAVAALEGAGIPVEERESVEEMIREVDVLETIGVLHPDHNASHDTGRPAAATPERFRVTPDVVGDADDVVVLHPLPRIDEISTEVDALAQAKYFEQCRNGMLMRMALLASVIRRPI